jgi:hypothetical protein
LIRLFRHQARLLLMLLIAWRQGGEDNQTVIDLVRTWMRDNPAHPVTAYLENISLPAAMADAPLMDLVDDLSMQTAALDLGTPTRGGDKPLIDTVVEILGLPWSTSRVTGEVLSSLRKVLMRPSEIEAFRKAAKDAFACAQCHHKFVSGEAVVAKQRPNQDYAVYCLLCASPDYGACANCSEAAPLNSAFSVALRNAKSVSCECRSLKKEKIANKVPTLTTDGAPGISLREATLRERMRQERDRLRNDLRDVGQLPRPARGVVAATPQGFTSAWVGNNAPPLVPIPTGDFDDET